MSRRSRLHYHLATIGYWASRIKARLPKPAGLLGDLLSCGAAVRYKLPSHTTSRQNRPDKATTALVSIRATAFRSWLPPIGPIKDFHLQSLRHARPTFFPLLLKQLLQKQRYTTGFQIKMCTGIPNKVS
jgi:hypothetical protein